MSKALRPTYMWSAMVLVSLLAVPSVGSSAEATSQPEPSRRVYEHAARTRAALQSRPAATRTKADYLRLIQTYQNVYRTSPSYGKTPVALSVVGDLYREMARLFSNPSHLQDAIKAYQFLAREYPHASLSRDGLYRIGEIYLTDLKQPNEAAKTFQDLINRYPKSIQASVAREKVKEIGLLLAEQARAQQARIESAATASQPERTPEVTDIRRWVGPHYSRIVIAVEGEAKFDTLRLSNPDRIVLDLAGTRLSSAVAGRNFPVEDGFLRGIRVAQFKSSVTRVVLDVEKVEDYSIFTLPNPFRLVVDIHGVSPEPSAETARALEPGQTPRRDTSVAEGPRALIKTGSASAATPAVGTATGADSRRGGGAMGAGAGSGKVLSKQPEGEKESASVRMPSATQTSKSPEPTTSPSASSRATPGAVTPQELGSPTLTRALGLKVARIVIDPGHGGQDTGAIGPGGLQEKDVVLDIARRLRKLLEQNTESEVILTRGDDTFIPLEERTALANEKAADLFISIHANASRTARARGIETYYLSFTSDPEALEVAARENATSQESVYQLRELIQRIALTEKVEESLEFARRVQYHVHARLGGSKSRQPNRGVKKAPFVVLIGANMPSILAEISFLSNPHEERLLKRSDYRQKLAEGLYRGVASYVTTLGTMRPAQKARLEESAARPLPPGASSPSSANF